MPKTIEFVKRKPARIEDSIADNERLFLVGFSSGVVSLMSATRIGPLGPKSNASGGQNGGQSGGIGGGSGANSSGGGGGNGHGGGNGGNGNSLKDSHVPPGTHRLLILPHGDDSRLNPIAQWKFCNGAVHCLKFSPNGKLLAIASQDGRLRVLDWSSFRLVVVFRSYFGAFLSLDWSPNGRYLLTGGEDDLVTLWDLKTRSLVARCPGHKSWVTSVSFDRWLCRGDRLRFGSVCQGQRFLLWDFSPDNLHRPRSLSSSSSSSIHRRRSPSSVSSPFSSSSSSSSSPSMTIKQPRGGEGEMMATTPEGIAASPLRQYSTSLREEEERLNGRKGDEEERSPIRSPSGSSHPFLGASEERTEEGEREGEAEEGEIKTPKTTQRTELIILEASELVESPNMNNVSLIEPVASHRVDNDPLQCLSFTPHGAVVGSFVGRVKFWTRPST